jgi:hypothetical protein
MHILDTELLLSDFFKKAYTASEGCRTKEVVISDALGITSIAFFISAECHKAHS